MSRKKIVAGNWKMNMTIDESNDLINELKEVSEMHTYKVLKRSMKAGRVF